MSLVDEITRFYRQPSPTSHLGRHADLLPGLPADPEALGAIVRGLLIHNFDAKMRGLEFPPERMAHMQAVGAEAILDNVLGLDRAPLGVERPVERRMVGFCYHFALLHCALLRATGTPARIRCGFARYFVPQWWMDHWVVEYWDGALRSGAAVSPATTSRPASSGGASAAPVLRGRLSTATENSGAGTNCGAA
jgi:hypothetical protein